MRKMLCEIDLEEAQGYPGRYLEHFSTTNRAPAYAECRELIAKLGLRYGNCPILCADQWYDFSFQPTGGRACIHSESLLHQQL